MRYNAKHTMLGPCAITCNARMQLRIADDHSRPFIDRLPQALWEHGIFRIRRDILTLSLRHRIILILTICVSVPLELGIGYTVVPDDIWSFECFKTKSNDKNSEDVLILLCSCRVLSRKTRLLKWDAPSSRERSDGSLQGTFFWARVLSSLLACLRLVQRRSWSPSCPCDCPATTIT